MSNEQANSIHESGWICHHMDAARAHLDQSNPDWTGPHPDWTAHTIGVMLEAGLRDLVEAVRDTGDRIVRVTHV